MFRFTLLITLVAVSSAAIAQSPDGSPNQRAMVVESTPSAQFAAGKKWAVVVGVNDYAFLADLEFCVDDARLIAKTLEEKCGYPEENILLIDSEQNEAGRRPAKNVMRRWLSKWLSQPAANDTVFVYFSGHGFETGGKRYFAPADCDPSEPEETCYSLEMLSELMADCPARQKVLVLDCCRNDPSKSFGDSSGNEELAAAFENAAGMITLASCRRGEVSWEWKEKKQGLYTYFLAEGLAGGADYDKDGVVDSGELNRYLSATVPLESRKQGRMQHPVEIRHDTVGVFALSQVETKQEDKPAQTVTSGAKQYDASFTVLEEETMKAVADAQVKLYWKSESGVKLLAAGESNSHGMVSLAVELTLEQQTEGETLALVRRGEKKAVYQLPNFPRQRTWPLTAPKLEEKKEEPIVANNHPTTEPTTIRPASLVRNEKPEEPDFSGVYQIRSRGNNRLLYLNGSDNLLSTRSVQNGSWTIFQIIRAEKGTYKIKSLVNGRLLHVDGQADNLVSTRAREDDIYTRFQIFSHKGEVIIRSAANRVNLHVDGMGDKLVSTRARENDVWTRFELVEVTAEFLQQLRTIAANRNAAARRTSSTTTTVRTSSNSNGSCSTTNNSNAAQRLNQMRNQSGWSEWKPVTGSNTMRRTSGWSEWKPVGPQTRRNSQGGNGFHNNGVQWNNGQSGGNFGGGMFGFGFGF